MYIGHKFFKEDAQNNVWTSIHTHCNKNLLFLKAKKEALCPRNLTSCKKISISCYNIITCQLNDQYNEHETG